MTHGALAEARWFGPESRARFAMLHWPTGAPRGAVVICPPVGYEAVCAHTALRHLAERLAAQGLAVLRIDYDGTGHSTGHPEDPDRVDAWVASIIDATEAFRTWGFSSVTLAGVRLGATLAVRAAHRMPDGTVDGFVLWDPIVNGRRFVRALQLLRAAGHVTDADAASDAADGSVTAGGAHYDADTLAAMKALRIEPTDLDRPTLVVAPSDGETDNGGADLAAAASSVVDVVVRPGTRALLDVDAELAVVPATVLDAITGWMAGHHRAPAAASPARPAARPAAHETVDGHELVHVARRVGSPGLLAIDTVEAGTQPARAVVLLNNGVARAVGPARTWVELGARLALDGARVVRFDLSGLGESPARPGRAENVEYPPTAADDFAALLPELRAAGVERVATIGLCSGAQLGLDAAMAHTEVDVVVNINGRFDRPFRDARRDRPKRCAGQANRFLAIPLHKTPLLTTFERVPAAVWWLLDRLHLVALPTVAIERAIAKGVSVLLVVGGDEWGIRALEARAPRRFARLCADRHVTLAQFPTLDHSMFVRSARPAVYATIRAYLAQCGITAERTPEESPA